MIRQAAFLVLIGCVGAAGATPTVDFARPDASVRFEAQGVQLDRTVRHAADGSAQIAVTYAPGAQPALTLSPASGSWNWSDRGELRLGLQNGMPWPVTLIVDIVGPNATHLRTTVGIPPGPPQTLIVPLAATSARAFGMQVAPPMPWQGNLVATGVEGAVDLHRVAAVRLSMPAPNAAQTLLFATLDTVPGQAGLHAAYADIVDRYGQATRSQWPEKIASDAALRAAAKSQTKPAPAADRFNGSARATGFAATGWFHTQQRDGRWYLVTPEGHGFFSLGVNAVSLDGGRSYVEGREWMFDGLPAPGDPLARFYGMADSRSDAGSQRDNGMNHGRWFDFYAANLQRTYGDAWLSTWAKVTVDRLLAWRFNTLGNWSEPTLARSKRIAYTVPVLISGDFATVGTGYDYWGRMPDPFDPRFVAATERAVTAATREIRDDPWLLGYFADNELAWAGVGPQGRWALATGALALGPDSPAKQAFVASLRKRYGEPAKLATAWGVSVASWDQLLAAGFAAPVPNEPHPAIVTDYIDFLHLYAETYFRTVAESLHRHDPRHLFLGGRLAVRTPEVEDACAKFCDVVSINMYTDLPEHGFDVAAARRRNKPVLITEFHFGSADRGPFGNGVAAVAGEDERGKAYARFVDAAVASGIVVGTHWFDYADQPATGRVLDGENSHIGLVGITDLPFGGFVGQVRAVNARVLDKP
jgi:hypothetical protein